MFQRHDNPRRMLGDGYALALNAGAVLQHMEFVQFYPLGLAEPGLPTMILPPSVADFGRFLNAKDEDIAAKYNVTEKPLAQRSRDKLSRALYLEISKGFQTSDSVFLDLTQINDEKERQMLARGDAYGSTRDILIHKVKIKEKPIRISPLCHHFMGGLIINCSCETNIRGLYAAGEVTGGIHGANRLGGNALSVAIVFGARAGQHAARYAKSVEASQLDLETANKMKKKMEDYFSNNQKEAVSCRTIKTTIKEIMWEKVGIIRNKENLEGAIVDLQRIGEENLPRLHVSKNREFLEALEIMNGLVVGEIVAKSALFRNESRGAHYRSDYPERNDKIWLKNIVIKKNEDKESPHPVIITKDVPPPS